MFGRRKIFVVLNTLTMALSLFSSVYLMLNFKKTAVLWLLGQVIAGIFILFISTYYFFQFYLSEESFNLKTAVRIKKDSIFSVIIFVFPIILVAILLWLQNHCYRFMIAKYFDLEFLGILGVGFALAANIATTVESLFQQLYGPIFFKKINTERPKIRFIIWSRMARLSLIVYIPLAIFVTFLAPFLLRILTNQKFSGALLFVIFGIWIEFFRMITNIFSHVAHSEMNTKYLIFPYFIGMIVTLSGIFIFKKSENYSYFIPMSILLGNIFIMSSMYYNMKKLFPIKINYKLIINIIVGSLPFILALAFYNYSVNIFYSIGVILLFGSYFLALQFFMYKKFVTTQNLDL